MNKRQTNGQAAIQGRYAFKGIDAIDVHHVIHHDGRAGLQFYNQICAAGKNLNVFFCCKNLQRFLQRGGFYIIEFSFKEFGICLLYTSVQGLPVKFYLAARKSPASRSLSALCFSGAYEYALSLIHI